jgi:hypothetical protein
MDLNAYVVTMGLTGLARYQKDRQIVIEGEFKPLDLRHLRSLPINSNQPRRSGRGGEPGQDVCQALPA